MTFEACVIANLIHMRFIMTDGVINILFMVEKFPKKTIFSKENDSYNDNNDQISFDV